MDVYDTLTVEEAAQWLKVHPRTVQALARKGDLPGAKIGRRWVFTTPGLQNYLAERIHNPTNPVGRPRKC